MALINRMWSAPNIVCVCVDRKNGDVIEGRMYNRYSHEGKNFKGVAPIIKYMDDLFEMINYPQSAVRERSFIEDNKPLERKETIAPLLDANALEDKAGEMMTLLVYVRYRQKATWQGWLYYKEGDQLFEFDSELDLIKILDQVDQF